MKTSKKRILVVEPAKHLHPLIESRLGQDFEVITVGSRDESLMLLMGKERFDAVAAAAHPCTTLGKYFEHVRKMRPHAKTVLLSGFRSPPADCEIDATVMTPGFANMREVITGLLDPC